MTRMFALAIALLTLLAVPAAAQVGDPHSFGRPMKWRGGFLGSNAGILLLADCSGVPETVHCVQLSPAPASTSFNVTDIETLVLPGNSASARTLLCQVVTPAIGYTVFNPDPQRPSQAHVWARGTLRIESAVLADPALINPLTGQPFDGFIQTTLPGDHLFDKMLDPLQSESVTDDGRSRFCIAGVLSKLSLMENYGLTAAQANSIFAGEIVLRLGIQGSARLLNGEHAFVRFHVRFLSD
jgi:hypothetical protein